MAGDFDRVRDAFASSLAGRGLGAIERTLLSAWRSSSSGAAAKSIRQALDAMPPPALIRTIAIAVMIAAVAQPFLMRMMPTAVVPAMPWTVFALIAIFAAGAAWQADSLIAAWPASRLARWIRR